MFEVGTTVAAALFGVHVAIAQHGGHGAPNAPAGTRDPARGDASVAMLLKHADESLTKGERAVERSDPRSVADALQEFVGTMDGLEAYFDAAVGDPERTRKEASKAQRALERHGARLGEMAGRAPAELRDAFSAARDARDRAHDASLAAYEEAAVTPAPAGSHHGGHHGCGHH